MNNASKGRMFRFITYCLSASYKVGIFCCCICCCSALPFSFNNESSWYLQTAPPSVLRRGHSSNRELPKEIRDRKDPRLIGLASKNDRPLRLPWHRIVKPHFEVILEVRTLGPENL